MELSAVSAALTFVYSGPSRPPRSGPSQREAQLEFVVGERHLIEVLTAGTDAREVYDAEVERVVQAADRGLNEAGLACAKPMNCVSTPNT